MKKIKDELLRILVCPLCKGELEYNQENQELICPNQNQFHNTKLAYQIRDGIPVMLFEEAKKFN
jgi:hypothetical protein